MSGILNRLSGRHQSHKMLCLAARKPVIHPAHAAGGADPRRPAGGKLRIRTQLDITCIISQRMGGAGICRPDPEAIGAAAPLIWALRALQGHLRGMGGPDGFLHGHSGNPSPQAKRHFRATVARTDLNSIIGCVII